MPYLTSDVFEGSNGQLFLAGGSNNVKALFGQTSNERSLLSDGWMSLLASRRRRLLSKSIQYRHCFVPDKLSIYRQESAELWDELSSPAEDLEQAIKGELSDVVVPLTAYFRKQVLRYPMYFKVDTHWTIEGCFSAYQMLCWALEVRQRPELVLQRSQPIELAGDLGGKITPKRLDQFQFGLFGRTASREWANSLITAREDGTIKNDVSLHVGSMVKLKNQGSECKLRVLLFGDSFSEYRSHYLTGLLSDTVSEIMFVWSTNIDYSIVEEYAPDFVVTEIAERFMARIPSDDIDITAHAQHKVEAALARLRRDET